VGAKNSRGKKRQDPGRGDECKGNISSSSGVILRGPLKVKDPNEKGRYAMYPERTQGGPNQTLSSEDDERPVVEGRETTQRALWGEEKKVVPGSSADQSPNMEGTKSLKGEKGSFISGVRKK